MATMPEHPRFCCPTCKSEAIRVEYAETATYPVVRWDDDGSVGEYNPDARDEVAADFTTYVCLNGHAFSEPEEVGSDA
jgi:hypothetical protein